MFHNAYAHIRTKIGWERNVVKKVGMFLCFIEVPISNRWVAGDTMKFNNYKGEAIMRYFIIKGRKIRFFLFSVTVEL